MSAAEPFFHAVLPEDWAEAQRLGEYRWSTRGMARVDVGFVHLARAHQYRGVLERYYADRPDTLVLVLDPERLGAEVRDEPAPDRDGELFPHLYGPLPVDAVVEVLGPGDASS